MTLGEAIQAFTAGIRSAFLDSDSLMRALTPLDPDLRQRVTQKESFEAQVRQVVDLARAEGWTKGLVETLHDHFCKHDIDRNDVIEAGELLLALLDVSIADVEVIVAGCGVWSFPDERWFLIDGITTKTHQTRISAIHLTRLFYRPITVVQSATDSLAFKMDPNFPDREIMTEPGWHAAAAMLGALNEAHTQRVVVIAHSQGTIIVANVLRIISETLQSDLVSQRTPRWLQFTERIMGGVETKSQKWVRDNLAHSLSALTEGGRLCVLERVAKLEVYTFANCARAMRYVNPARQVPYMEHFVNEGASPLSRDVNALIEMDGPIFIQTGASDHLLIDDYLEPIDHYLYPGSHPYRRDENPYPHMGEGAMHPRLYAYFHGKRPY